MKYFVRGIKKYAEFSGRASRREFWIFVLGYSLIYIAAKLIELQAGGVILSTLCSLFFLIPSLSCGARRLHDIGRSGWWQLLYFIPLVGILVVIYFFVQKSDEDNGYGKKIC